MKWPFLWIVAGYCLTSTSTVHHEQCCDLYFPRSQDDFYIVDENITWNFAERFSDEVERKLKQELDLDDGARARLPFVIPVIFSLGAITTMLVVVTVMAFKGLAVSFISFCVYIGGRMGYAFTPYPAPPPPYLRPRRPVFVTAPVFGGGVGGGWYPRPSFKFVSKKRPFHGWYKYGCKGYGCKRMDPPPEQEYSDHPSDIDTFEDEED